MTSVTTSVLAIGLATALLGCTDKPETCAVACTDNDVCIRGTCEDAFDRNWIFTADNIVVAPTEPDGTMWDSSDDSPPDPYAVIVVDTVTILTTKTVSDSYTADWQQSAPPTNLTETSLFSTTATDADTFGAGDQIVQCGPMNLTADVLRAGSLACDGAGGSMMISFVPE